MPPSEWEVLEWEVYWMKRQPGIYWAAVDDFDAHPWARRMSMHAAQLACRPLKMREELRKSRGLGCWGTLYLLQRLAEDGEPEQHLKARRGPRRRLR